MARMFDSSSPFSVCFVYSMWSMLNESIKVGLANNQEVPVAGGVFDQMVNAVLADWGNFDHDVYSAAFLLCQLHHQTVAELHRGDREEFSGLRDATIRTLVRSFRRWAPNAQGARAVSLAEDDDAVSEWKNIAEEALDAYILQEKPWKPGFINDALAKRTSPVRFWSIRAPSTCLNEYAARIVSLNVSSSEAERTHKVFKANRSKTRNRLSYPLNQGLAFAKIELARDQRCDCCLLSPCTETQEEALR